MRQALTFVVHEVAHKLIRGTATGPAACRLSRCVKLPAGEHDLHAAMNNIQDEIDLVGESAASIDAYAATDPAECFAVPLGIFFQCA